MTTISVENLARACEAVGDLIAEIRPEQWKERTPCTEWDVREVVTHLVGMDLVFAAMIEGGPMPERGVDRLGDDPVGAYRSSSAALQAAFSGPGVLERSFHGPLGSATGAERLQIRLYDLLAHGWDLAQATGIPVRLPAEVGEQSLAFARVQLATQNRTGRFAEPQPVDETAPAIDRLVAFLGRTVAPQQ
ncbi:TIGR03086 family metal-binding protein [Streptomyces sp. H10-C2]|uniref:TIGR03086 family metal-binding protein n=1 Tax=unclassified Streptomyces TaxID=2593676 RepID=UPI0024B8D8D5|nr:MULTISPECIES: TIGR03086 family metal-binding protein [unclassified Streptomyces]MDJ0341882.1 TIGR03086 family metal-binding protein [Streptomyces sp. PH10-H1]MDJ0370364.1 TIGR03086 family metal-binding protein [Streptomyces sp. H10-C2]